jgi:hypothetical protein
MERSEHPIWPIHEPRDPSPAAIGLAGALAMRLDSVVPRPFQVRAEGGWVSLYHGDTFDGASDVASILDQELDAEDDEEWPFADRVQTVAWNVLSRVQDAIAEATTDPWPRLSAGGMAEPGMRVDANVLYLWYGADSNDEATAVLSLPLIPLGGLTDAR